MRRVAVTWIQDLSSDELVDYLPQLVQAVKHETYETSPLARLLLQRALTSPRVAHHLYWLLTQALPGPSPQVVLSFKTPYQLLLIQTAHASLRDGSLVIPSNLTQQNKKDRHIQILNIINIANIVDWQDYYCRVNKLVILETKLLYYCNRLKGTSGGREIRL